MSSPSPRALLAYQESLKNIRRQSLESIAAADAGLPANEFLHDRCALPWATQEISVEPCRYDIDCGDWLVSLLRTRRQAVTVRTRQATGARENVSLNRRPC